MVLRRWPGLFQLTPLQAFDTIIRWTIYKSWKPTFVYYQLLNSASNSVTDALQMSQISLGMVSLPAYSN